MAWNMERKKARYYQVKKYVSFKNTFKLKYKINYTLSLAEIEMFPLLYFIVFKL